ncbi:class I SAM-dependent methyltransferase [Paraconexibacter antarcticus]|uniref:Class I SAM-dependent methyltransferase n=1 Tax=Paraconexibacter antarcticus TaxID=2949664 RepID=A0ABY5DX02_9ACTN|nr:class I SAM-dependent methyltransferase [Paraconexibacter antarcticus]UTI65079.1 class I SAM-dependent methyltransferase [Paraconexibacter antarcticus]
MSRLGELRYQFQTRNEHLVDALGAVGARASVAPAPASGPVSDALYARLSPAHVAALEEAIEGDVATLWADLAPDDRRRLLVSVAAFYRQEEALATMGLTAAEPPPEVHAMARGPLATGGDLGMADFVVQTLLDAGVELPQGGTVLDFGCSSGRALRPIAAWRPDLQCLGCDPNAEAIAWAAGALPMARWFQSPIDPPLELADASVDVAYAISIWSHFAAGPAGRWLDEMHRVIRPGGVLLLTTHGLDTFATYIRGHLMNRGLMAEAIGGMLRDGVHFIDVFGEAGDWGVKDEGWGNSFLLADWLIERATPAWSVRLLRRGRLDGNQDAFVLERIG